MIDNLKAFAAVIDSKSLTKAASRLFLTQSAISRRIQQLEEALGGTLLDRTQRPPSSTALGQRVYEQSLPILCAVDDLMTLTRQDAAPTGTLRFGMSQAIGDVIMADAVEQLSGEFPTLDVRVRAGWGAGLAAQVGAGELDNAIVMLPAGTQPAAPLIMQSRRRPRVRSQLHWLTWRSGRASAPRPGEDGSNVARLGAGFGPSCARIPPTRQTCEKPLSLASPVSSMKSRRRWGRRDCL
jgi:DNA-binding transcriptional LysR family regulator